MCCSPWGRRVGHNWACNRNSCFLFIKELSQLGGILYPKMLCAPWPLLSCFPRLPCSVQSVPFSAVSPPLAHVNFIQKQLKATEVFICSRGWRGRNGAGREKRRGRKEKWRGRRGRSPWLLPSTHLLPWHRSWGLAFLDASCTIQKRPGPIQAPVAHLSSRRVPRTQDHLCTRTEEGGMLCQAGRIDRQ